MERLIFTLIYIVPAALIAIVLHEMAHGYVSYKLGDPTPKINRRISLNPKYHLDLIGTLLLIFFGFGWAKPVNVNPKYYKKQKLGMILVSLSGPIMNLIIAFISIFIANLIIKIQPEYNNIIRYIYNLFKIIALYNVGLGVFNLIPIPPLDGSKVLNGILPQKIYFRYMKYENYGVILLMILLISGILNGPLLSLQDLFLSGINGLVNLILGI